MEPAFHDQGLQEQPGEYMKRGGQEPRWARMNSLFSLQSVLQYNGSIFRALFSAISPPRYVIRLPGLKVFSAREIYVWALVPAGSRRMPRRRCTTQQQQERVTQRKAPRLPKRYEVIRSYDRKVYTLCYCWDQYNRTRNSAGHPVLASNYLNLYKGPTGEVGKYPLPVHAGSSSVDYAISEKKSSIGAYFPVRRPDSTRRLDSSAVVQIAV